MNSKQAFGMAVKILRSRHGIAQEQLAPSQSYVSDVERGLKSPSVEKLIELSAHLGVHPATVLIKSQLLQDPEMSKEMLLSQISQELEGESPRIL